MSTASHRYVSELHSQSGYLATWLPNTEVRLGDVCVLEGDTYNRRSSLKDLGVPFDVRVGRSVGSLSYTSKSGVSVDAKASGNVASTGKGQASIQLSGEGAFVFQLKDAIVDEIGDKVSVGAEVMDRYRAGVWDADWCIVDTIVRAGSATIVISNSKNGSLALSATSTIELDNLAKVDMGLRVSAQQGDVLHFLATSQLVPLFKLSRIKRSLLAKVLGVPLTFGGPAAPATTTAPPALGGEPALEEVSP